MTIKIELAPDLETFARNQASSTHAGDVAEYIRSLLVEQFERARVPGGKNLDTDQALLEAIDDEEDELTPEYWEQLRLEGEELAAKLRKM